VDPLVEGPADLPATGHLGVDPLVEGPADLPATGHLGCRTRLVEWSWASGPEIWFSPAGLAWSVSNLG
jgi:hypothetical protein